MTHRAPVLDEPAPQTLKRYRLLGQLARGGMAEVFLARANGLGGFERLLVIKRILPELASDSEFVRMFLDEARTAAMLHHSNIVQVYDVDMADGHVFYAMEHLHGQDVAATLRRLAARSARIPLDNAIAITVAVAAGLQYAHERWGSDGRPLDIVHRDVTPNNVIVTYDGNVKLIDFGIAKAANNLSRTRFGLFKGKLPYASPEQCRCEAVDRRTDVFSLGVLLYELTTGEQLFTADNEYELLRVVSEAVVPRPRLRDKSYPRELEAIVLKALAHDRDDRYLSAQALQYDLEVFANRLELDLSAMSLSRLMEHLFTDELTHWQTAQRAGVTLEQHLITITAPIVAIAPAPAPAMPPTPADEPIEATYEDAVAAAPAGRRVLGKRALVAAAALGLVGAGALGARWLASPPAERPAPAVTVSTMRPDPAREPVAPATAASEPVVTARPEPVQPVVTATPPDKAPEKAIVRVHPPAPHPTRRPKRSHPRGSQVAHPPAEPEPPAAVAPAERARPVLDDSTLDDVVPRSTRSP